MPTINRTTHISFPNMENTDLHDITHGIAEGSLSLDEILCSGNIELGQYCSNKFEVQLYDIADVTGEKIVVWQTDESTTPATEIPIFVGYVDSCKQDVFGRYRDIVAYDELYTLGSKDVAQWWTDFWDREVQVSTGYPLSTIRQSLLSYVGIPVVTPPEGGYVNDALRVITGTEVVRLLFADILKMICELQCLIPNINRSGELDFITLSAESATDITDNVDTGRSSFEEFTTADIDAVWIYDASPVVVGTGGEGDTNPYKIQGNIVAYGMYQSTLNMAATAIYNVLSTINYIPAKLALILSDLNLGLGEYVKFSKGYTFIFSNSLSGTVFIAQDIEAGGSQYLSDNRSLNTDITELKKQIDAAQFYVNAYTNDHEIEIGDGEQHVILNIRVSAVADSIVVFHAEVPIEIKIDDTMPTPVDGVYSVGDYEMEVQAKYQRSGQTIDYAPIETYSEDGKHILHLLYAIPLVKQESIRWLVLLKAIGGTIKIEELGIQAVMSGAGLLADAGWDGTITYDENVGNIPVDAEPITVAAVSVDVDINIQTPIPITVDEDVDSVNIEETITVDTSALSEDIDFEEVVKRAVINTDSTTTYSSTYVEIANRSWKLITEYTAQSTTQQIDSGYCTKVTPYITGLTVSEVTIR